MRYAISNHDAGVEPWVAPYLGGMPTIAAGQQIELQPLPLRKIRRNQSREPGVFEIGAAISNPRPLETRGQKRRAIVLRPSVIERRAEAQKPGQTLVLGPQAVEGPGPQAGPGEHPASRVDVQQGRSMRDLVAAVHRTDYTQVIGHRTNLGEQIAHLEPTLAMLLELPGRGQQVSRGGELELRLRDRQGLTIHFGQLWFGIERINVRDPSMHEQKNHLSGGGGKVPSPCRQGFGGGPLCFCGQQPLQSQLSKPQGRRRQPLTASQRDGPPLDRIGVMRV